VRREHAQTPFAGKTVSTKIRRRVIRLSFSPEVRGTLSLVDRDVASLNGDARRDERGSARYPGAKDDEQRRGQIARLVGAFTIVHHLQPEGSPATKTVESDLVMLPLIVATLPTTFKQSMSKWRRVPVTWLKSSA